MSTETAPLSAVRVEPVVGLTAKDILPGRCYEAKRPAPSGFIPQLCNDRQVKWVSPTSDYVQYDSPTVRYGRRYPKVSMEKFLTWAGRDVTSLMPKGKWRDWKPNAQVNRPL